LAGPPSFFEDQRRQQAVHVLSAFLDSAGQ